MPHGGLHRHAIAASTSRGWGSAHPQGSPKKNRAKKNPLNRQPVKWAVVSGAGRLKELSALVIEWMQAVPAERPQMASKFNVERLEFNVERLIEGWNRGRDPILKGAPHLALAHGAKVDTSASGACTIAIAHLELLASSFGWAPAEPDTSTSQRRAARRFGGLSKFPRTASHAAR